MHAHPHTSSTKTPHAPCTPAPPSQIEEWLSRSSGIPLEELRPYLFLLRDRDATHHLMRVSGGLDSLVMGEGQILAQVRRGSCQKRRERTAAQQLCQQQEQEQRSVHSNSQEGRSWCTRTVVHSTGSMCYASVITAICNACCTPEQGLASCV